MEQWRPIYEFNGYHISDHGQVLNEKTGRVLKLSVNQRGIVYVGLMRNKVQHKRSVAVLVAKRFLAPPPNEAFDAIINLDGDRNNNFASNLNWRPDWFARKYQRQFAYYTHTANQPIVDIDRGIEYFNVWEAASRHGLLVTAVALSLETQEPVWPTRQRFMRRLEF